MSRLKVACATPRDAAGRLRRAAGMTPERATPLRARRRPRWAASDCGARTLTDMGVADFLLAGDLTSPDFHEAVDAADEAGVSAVLALADHHDPEVRAAVVLTLPLLLHGDAPTAEMV